MKRHERLRKGRAFDTAYREGAVIRSPFFILRHRENGVGHPRWGFAVGKRLARRAVERNRVRRRLREAARASGYAGGKDVVLTARAPALDAGVEELATALRKALKRMGRRVAE